MIAIINMVRQAPAWLFGLLALVALLFVTAIHERSIGAGIVRKEWAAADAAALVKRNGEIDALTQKQAASSAQVQLRHDVEMAAVRARIANAPRMRLPAFCKPAAAPADPTSTKGSNDASTGAGLLPERTDEDFKALILAAEEAAATARAAQEFIRANGMTH